MTRQVREAMDAATWVLYAIHRKEYDDDEHLRALSWSAGELCRIAMENAFVEADTPDAEPTPLRLRQYARALRHLAAGVDMGDGKKWSADFVLRRVAEAMEAPAETVKVPGLFGGDCGPFPEDAR